MFSLLWDAHNGFIAKTVSNMYKIEEYCDCKIVVANGFSLLCHKLVLSSFSVVFKNIIDNYNNSDILTITLCEVTAAELTALVEFMYTGETRLAAEVITGFFDLCQMLKMSSLDIKVENLADNSAEDNDLLSDTIPAINDEKIGEFDDWVMGSYEVDEMFDDSSVFLIRDVEAIKSDEETFPLTDKLPRKGKILPLSEKLLNVKIKYRKINLQPQPKNFNLNLDDIRDLGESHPKRYQCKKCGSQYSHKRTIKHHLCWICGQPPTHACQFCSYRGKRKFQLRSHLQRVHQIEIRTKT